MFETFEQARRYVDENSIKMIDLKFCDLWGRWRHVTLLESQFTPEFMESGVGFDGSAVGLKSVKAGDMVLLPDLSTGFFDPFWEVPTLGLICSTREAGSMAIFDNDPRNVAVQAECFLRSAAIADESR